MSNIPEPTWDPRDTYEVGLSYINLGWKVFLLSADGPEGKIPFANCDRCNPRTGTCKRHQDCQHLLCHGFYAATNSAARWSDMVYAQPSGYLAIRTGRASNLLVVDVESYALDLLDRWPEMVQGDWVLPPTWTATSQGGGLHLYYCLGFGPNDTIVKSGRIFDGVDIKAEGGYVAAVGSRHRRRQWKLPRPVIAQAPSELVDFLQTERVRQRSYPNGPRLPRGDGYDFARFIAEGCPAGFRDEFFNDLIFRYRKRDYDYSHAFQLVLHQWRICEQPIEYPGPMPWEHVKYKLDRVWNEVEADPAIALTEVQRVFVELANENGQVVEIQDRTNLGGASLVRRRG